MKKLLNFIKNWFTIKEIYRCKHCDFRTDNLRGLKIHIGRMHKNHK